jgi:hypothetical protein
MSIILDCRILPIGRNMDWRSLRINFLIVMALGLTIFMMSFVQVGADEGASSSEEYGPPNMLKTLPTPFTTAIPGEKSESNGQKDLGLTPIAISSKSISLNRNVLEIRFHGPKLYLPASMILGECAEFTVKGPAGFYTAIAMSDSNKGAKPISGHQLRLGADRKLIALGIIPETGILPLLIETPIQGDLVGVPLYFEAVVWSKSDFSDLQMASTISTTQDSSDQNGVLVAAQPEEKKERAVKFDVSKSISAQSRGGLSSGKP